jgi:aspartate-semialdehyde dehydrogenase
LADRIALIGSETLLGREIRDVFGETALGQQLHLVAAETEEAGTLTEIAGSAAFLSKLEPEEVEDAAVLILAGSSESSKEAIDANPSGVVIDLTYATENDPQARVRAPMVEDEEYESDHTGPQVVAHPAAIAIAAILRRLHTAWPIQRAIVQIFEPASERGTPGIEELQQQAVSLLSLKPLPQKVYGTQLSFAMLSQYGTAAPLPLHEIEERIERHLASLLERMDGVPMPSLRLIQAPVFHGYSFSFWIEFEDSVTASDLEETMNSEPLDVRTADFEPPNNVGVAGQNGIAVGAIAPDRNSGNAFWLWAATDNLRLSAENAALIAGEIV